MSHALRKILVFTSLISTLLVSCDDSQSVTQDNGIDSEKNVDILLNENIIGNINAYGLDEQYYKDVTVGGTPSHVVSIATLITQGVGIPTQDFDQYYCNYESANDGFRPTDKGERCAAVLCSERAELSYLDTASGNLIYDDNANVTDGCYNIKNLGKIILTKVNQDAKYFEIYKDGERQGHVDITTIENKIITLNGKKVILLKDVLTVLMPSLVKDHLNDYLCDFVDDSNQAMSANTDCPARPCSDALNSYIDINTLDIIAPNADDAACYHMNNASKLHISSDIDAQPFPIEIFIDDVSKGSLDVQTLRDKIQKDNDAEFVYASDIIHHIAPDADLNLYLCNYIGTNKDGSDYDPQIQKPANCGELKSCHFASDAKVYLATHQLHTTADGFPNCFNTGGLKQIKLYSSDKKTDPTPIAQHLIDIEIGDDPKITIDIASLADKVIEENGQSYIRANDIIAAAKNDIDLSAYQCNYLGGNDDGSEFDPLNKGNCKATGPLSCTYAADGKISLENYKISFSNQDVPSCFNVGNLVKIKLFPVDHP